MATIAELEDRLADLQEKAINIQAKADAEKRDFTAEESDELDSIFAAVDDATAERARRQKIEDNNRMLNSGPGRQTQPEPPEDEPIRSVNKPNKPKTRIEPLLSHHDKSRAGFSNFGDFSKAVRMGSIPGGEIDNRLLWDVRNAPTTSGSESVGADGGFAVPPEFRQAIMETVLGEDSLAARCDNLTTSGNSITVPMDETTPWQTSGGVQSYWDGELDQQTQSKPALKQNTIRLDKLTALVPVSEELLEDAPALDSYLRAKAPQKMQFKLNLGIVQGNGVGQPLGILNSGALVSVAKVGSQVADTIVGLNIINMWARLYGPCRQNAVWLINQDIEPQLFTLMKQGKLDTGAVDTGWGVPLYVPPGGLSGTPFGTLFGRPVIPTQACETLGDKGDIVLADLSKFMCVTKGSGIRTDVSMHLYFDYGALAYRFILRVAGHPWWTSSIAPRDGSNTLSCFVTLDARA